MSSSFCLYHQIRHCCDRIPVLVSFGVHKLGCNIDGYHHSKNTKNSKPSKEEWSSNAMTGKKMKDPHTSRSFLTFSLWVYSSYIPSASKVPTLQFQQLLLSPSFLFFFFFFHFRITFYFLTLTEITHFTLSTLQLGLSHVSTHRVSFICISSTCSSLSVS